MQKHMWDIAPFREASSSCGHYILPGRDCVPSDFDAFTKPETKSTHTCIACVCQLDTCPW